MEITEEKESLLKKRLETFDIVEDNIPMWAYEKLKKPEQLENFLFYNLLPARFYNKKVVKTAQIVGTTHQSYNEGNWISMFENLHRNKYMFDREEIKLFIANEDIQEKKQVSKYGDLYFIDQGGNHRICFAKFLGLNSVCCDVQEYIFDQESFDLYNKLRKLNLHVTIKNRKHWEINVCKLKVFIDIDQLKSFIQYYNSIKVSWLHKFILRLNIKKYKNESVHYLHYIGKKSELNLIKRHMVYLCLLEQKEIDEFQDKYMSF